MTSNARRSPGRRQVALARRRPEQDQVLENPSRRAGLNASDGRGIAAQSFAQIDHAVLAEVVDGLACRGVDRLQVVVHREDQPAVFAVLALPVVHAAGGHRLHALADPDFLSGLRIERDQRAVAPAAVDHAAGDDRIGAGLAVGVGPGDRELLDVRLVDLTASK